MELDTFRFASLYYLQGVHCDVVTSFVDVFAVVVVTSVAVIAAPYYLYGVSDVAPIGIEVVVDSRFQYFENDAEDSENVDPAGPGCHTDSFVADDLSLEHTWDAEAVNG